MWKIEIIQTFYDIEDMWAGQGYPVTLESKLGDTKGVLDEIRTFLKERGDKRPLAVTEDALDNLWNEARQDPRAQYELELRSDDYTPTGPNDEFDGTVAIELWASYNIEKAQEKAETQQEPPSAEPEQLDLF